MAQGQPTLARYAAEPRERSQRNFFSNVFLVMTGDLVLTALVSLALSSNHAVMASLFHLVTYSEDGETKTTFEASGLYWCAAAFEILLVIVLSWSSLGKRLNFVDGLVLFGIYAALNGVTLAPLLYAYTAVSIVRVFFIAASMFCGMAIWGLTTKVNLTGLQSFFLMALIGLLAAILMNAAFGSVENEFYISVAAVGLFAGLTAFDMQKLRAMHDESAGASAGLVVFGALTLYLDFINLFIHLLRIFGVARIGDD